jgi:c-di-GMP-binding flagellar brake protein YcgR
MARKQIKKKTLKERRKNIRSTGSSEQRSYIRTNVYVPMALYIQGPKETEKLHARTCNISASGMMIELDTQVPIAEKVKIDITLPGTLNPIHCFGKAVWSDSSGAQSKFQCGIEFVSIEEDNKNTFLKFLCDLIYKGGDAE